RRFQACRAARSSRPCDRPSAAGPPASRGCRSPWRTSASPVWCQSPCSTIACSFASLLGPAAEQNGHISQPGRAAAAAGGPGRGVVRGEVRPVLAVVAVDVDRPAAPGAGGAGRGRGGFGVSELVAARRLGGGRAALLGRVTAEGDQQQQAKGEGAG